jgi:hypothetical protein
VQRHYYLDAACKIDWERSIPDVVKALQKPLEREPEGEPNEDEAEEEDEEVGKVRLSLSTPPHCSPHSNIWNNAFRPLSLCCARPHRQRPHQRRLARAAGK